MYAQATKASLDTSEKMHNVAALITSSDVIGVSGLSKVTLTLLRFFISWKKRIHSSRSVDGSSLSHSNPLCHNHCIPILVRTVNPIGSISRAIRLSIPRLVGFISTGGLSLNIKASSAWFRLSSLQLRPVEVSRKSPSGLLSLF